MSALAVPFVVCVALFLVNAFIWGMQGHALIACGWIAAIPCLFYFHRWLLE